MIIRAAEEVQPSLPLVQSPSWLNGEMMRITQNWTKPEQLNRLLDAISFSSSETHDKIINDIMEWIQVNGIDLTSLTLEDAIRQSTPWRTENDDKKRVQKYFSNKVVYKYKDGWNMVMVDTNKDANIEALVMVWEHFPVENYGKVPGHPAYKVCAYSLRNPLNIPHASMEAAVFPKTRTISLRAIIGRDDEKDPDPNAIDRHPQPQYRERIKEWIDSLKSQGWKFRNEQAEEAQNESISRADFLDAEEHKIFDEYGIPLHIHGVGEDVDNYYHNIEEIVQAGWDRSSAFGGRKANQRARLLVDYAAAHNELPLLEEARWMVYDKAYEFFITNVELQHVWPDEPDEKDFMTEPDEKPEQPEFRGKKFRGKPVPNKEAYEQAKIGYEQAKKVYQEELDEAESYDETLEFLGDLRTMIEGAKPQPAPTPVTPKKAEMTVKIHKIAKAADVPDSETIGAYIETLTLYYRDNQGMDPTLADLIRNLPSARQVKKDFSEKQCQILFETIQFLWRKLTGQDIIKESKITHAPESLSGSYWMLPNGVLLHGLNHFSIVKQNTNIFTSLLDINGFALQEYMHTGPEGLVHFIIKNGGVRMFINREKKFFAQLSDETYSKWAGEKLKKYDFKSKVVRIIDLKSPYRGWKSGIAVRV